MLKKPRDLCFKTEGKQFHSIKEKCCKELLKCVLLRHSNALGCNINIFFDLVKHQPYLPDLIRSDYRPFQKLKGSLCGIRSHTNNGVIMYTRKINFTNTDIFKPCLLSSSDFIRYF